MVYWLLPAIDTFLGGGGELNTSMADCCWMFIAPSQQVVPFILKMPRSCLECTWYFGAATVSVKVIKNGRIDRHQKLGALPTTTTHKTAKTLHMISSSLRMRLSGKKFTLKKKSRFYECSGNTTKSISSIFCVNLCVKKRNHFDVSDP